MINQLYMTLDIFSFLIMLLMYLSNWRNNNKNASVHFFMLMTIALMGVFLSDGLTFAVLGHNTSKVILSILWTSNYLSTVVLFYFFHFYVVSFINDYTEGKEAYLKTYYMTVAVAISVLWIVGAFFNLFIVFEGPTGFHNTKLHPLTQYPILLLYVPDIYLIIKNRKYMGSKIWVWLLFLFAPVLARFLDKALHISLAYPVMGLCLVFIYDALNQETDMALRVQQVELQKQEKELQDTREKIVISQIQPHFLYNVLNTICILCRRNPQLAEKTTSDFATYLRMNLDSLSLDAPVPFADELRHTEIYLSLEKLRFGDEMNVVWDIKTRSFLIPVLSLQPIVENAVKHGICQKEDGGTVTISTWEDEANFYLKVEDDGVGFDPNNVVHKDGRTHIGVENTRKRIELLCQGTMDLESTPGVGTIVLVTLPKGGQKK